MFCATLVKARGLDRLAGDGGVLFSRYPMDPWLPAYFRGHCEDIWQHHAKKF